MEVAVPASVAAATACLVENARTATAYGSLVRAIAAAARHDTLVIHGTCRGTLLRAVAAFEIPRSMTLRGVTTTSSGPATLDGSGVNAVVGVDRGAHVKLAGLRIRHGLDFGVFSDFNTSLKIINSSVQGNQGTGVDSFGPLTVRNSRVVNNHGGSAAISQVGGRVRIYDSLIAGNTVGVAGIDIAGDRHDPVEIVRSTISWNVGHDAGGIFLLSDPYVSIRHSLIAHNTVTETIAGDAGGINIAPDATVVLVDSLVRNNTAANHGGGIDVRFGSLTLAGESVIRDNLSGASGGGLAVDQGTASTADGSSDIDPATGLLLPAWSGRIFHNSPDNCALLGGVLDLTCG